MHRQIDSDKAETRVPKSALSNEEDGGNGSRARPLSAFHLGSPSPADCPASNSQPQAVVPSSRAKRAWILRYPTPAPFDRHLVTHLSRSSPHLAAISSPCLSLILALLFQSARWDIDKVGKLRIRSSTDTETDGIEIPTSTDFPSCKCMQYRTQPDRLCLQKRPKSVSIISMLNCSLHGPFSSLAAADTVRSVRITALGKMRQAPLALGSKCSAAPLQLYGNLTHNLAFD